MRILILSALIILFSSCNTQDFKSEYIILKGVAKNNTVESLILRDNYYNPVDTLMIKNNHFIDTLYVETGYYRLSYENNDISVFLKKGKDVTMSFDTNNLYNSIKYKDEENNYLASKDKLRKSILERQINVGFYETLDEKSFLKKNDSVYKAYLDLFNKQENLNISFNGIEVKAIDIDNALRIYQYEGKKRMMENNLDFKISNDYPNPFESIDLDNPELLITYTYKNLVDSYFQDRVNKLMTKRDGLDFFLLYQQQLANSNLDTSIIDLIGLDNSEYGFTYTKYLEEYYKTYLSFAKTEKYISKFKERYMSLKTAIGEPSANFKFESIDGKNYTLDDFKGKYIYIDLWASWCGPCISQIPYLKKLEEKYSYKINFVSIAFNDIKANWKSIIKEKNLKGIQLFAKNKNDNFFMFFDVKSIPRFILLNKEGNIIDYRAKQPSEESLDIQFSELK